MLDNTQGTLLTNKALVLLNENNLINDNGLIQSGKITKIDAQNISNNQGKLIAGQQITLTTPKTSITKR